MDVLKYAAFVYFCFLCGVTNAQTSSCGAELTAHRGNLLSSDYPFPMETKTSCKWNFNVTAADLVYVSFNVVYLADDDNLTIYDGIDNRFYTGANVTRSLMLIMNAKGSTIHVDVGSSSANSPRKFMASYTSTDNTVFTTEHSGMIKSPEYSKRNGTIDYTWIITTQPDTSIYLSFKSFNISDGNLTITDSKQTWNLTGSELPNDIATTTASVQVHLQMSIVEPDLKFELFHSQLHPNCSKEINLGNATEFDITFDEPEIEFPVKCFIIVEGPKDSVLSVGVRAFESKASAESNTIFELNDGGSRFSPNILVYSPTSQLEAPPNVLTNTNRLWIGYMAMARQHPLNVSAHINVHNSGKHLRESGSFTLPTSNATMPSNTSMYILSVASNQQVVTTVAPNATLSQSDFILFYDGAVKEKLLANFTANTTFYPVVATENQMLIIANNFEGKDTFSASFVAAPKGTNLLSSGRLGSYQLNEIPANSSHFWIIAPLKMNASSEIIALTLNSVKLDGVKILTIYSGATDSADVLYTMTNSTSNVVVHIDGAQGARIVLQNNGNASSGVVVDASYQVQPRCEFLVNLTALNETTISTPSFPNLYPANAHCRWDVVTSSQKIYLTFESLNLPASQPVLIHSVKDQSFKLLRNVSGSGIVDDFITNETQLAIVWTSSLPLHNLTVSTGFKIRAYPLDCGGEYGENEKEFQTPNYPKAVTNSTLCVWSVSLNPKKGDDVEIINLHYTNGDIKTGSAELVIHEGGSVQSSSANMSAINQTSFLSRTNKLLIWYAYTSDKAGGSAYKFTYEQHLCSHEQLCGNGICLHDSWRCNGVNDCGDFTDEVACAASPVVPAPVGGISVAAFVITMFVMVVLGVAIALGGPILWRKIKTQSSYQEFRNTADA